MDDNKFYDTIDAINSISKKYPLIPKFIIRRVLYAEELYMFSVGIIDYKPSLSWWVYRKKK